MFNSHQLSLRAIAQHGSCFRRGRSSARKGLPAWLPRGSPACWPQCPQTCLRSSARALPPTQAPRGISPRRLDAASASDRAGNLIWPAPKAGVRSQGFARQWLWFVPSLIAPTLLGDTGIHAYAYPATIRQGLLAAPDAHATDTLDGGVGSQVHSDAGAAINGAPKPWVHRRADGDAGRAVVLAGACPGRQRARPSEGLWGPAAAAAAAGRRQASIGQAILDDHPATVLHLL